MYNVEITSTHSPPRKIPEGKIYIFVKNRLNMLEEEPVMKCPEHSKERGEGGVLTSSSSDMRPALLDKKHHGLMWSIPETGGRLSYRSTLGFTCCTLDAKYATKASKWMMYFMGSRGFEGEGILANFENVKAMKMIRKCGDKPKVAEETEEEEKLSAEEKRKQKMNALKKKLAELSGGVASVEPDAVHEQNDYDFYKIFNEDKTLKTPLEK